MSTPALMGGFPFVGLTTTGGQLGAVLGTVVAVPQKRQGGDIAISVQMTFSGAPGASVFKLMMSNDGVNFLDTGLTISDTASMVKTMLAAVLFLRLDQTSKTNAVTATGTIVMG